MEHSYIVRPLLGCDRSEIEGYLDRMGIPYCTDATNNEDDYTRNKIRHKILPLMVEINEQAVEHICDMAELAAAQDIFLRDCSDKTIIDKLRRLFGAVFFLTF